MIKKIMDKLNKSATPLDGFSFIIAFCGTLFYSIFKKRETFLSYKSSDNYFDITEEFKDNQIYVIYYYSTPIFGISNFTTTYIYNMNGDLIEYSNDLGDIISHRDNPKIVFTPPKLLKDF